MKTIAIIGCGNLGLSIVEGLLDDSKHQQYRFIATRRNTRSIGHLTGRGVVVTSDNVYAVREADVIVVAVKPYNVDRILQEIAAHLDHSRHTVVSLATGVTIASIYKEVDNSVAVFRAMPNTATLVKESVTCISYNDASEEQVKTVSSLFDGVGRTLIIREDLMEAATILGACGIAYALRFIRAMTQGGIQIGFSAEVASLIASQTVKGAAELLLSGDTHPEGEIDKVTTPKGCTIVGLNEMEHAGFSSALIKGIVTSFDKIAD
jgi:pyrroline-5-carboxylate reductase